jgi:hypothetical protein
MAGLQMLPMQMLLVLPPPPTPRLMALLVLLLLLVVLLVVLCWFALWAMPTEKGVLALAMVAT